MKNIASTLFMSLVLCCCSAQTLKLDIVDIKEVKLENRKLFSLSIQDVESILGNPDSTVMNYDPIVDDAPFYDLFYGHSSIGFQNDRVVNFKLSDNRFKLLDDVRIGMEENSIKKRFPKSFEQKYRPTDENFEIVPVALSNNGVVTDSYLHILIENMLVTNIQYWENP